MRSSRQKILPKLKLQLVQKVIQQPSKTITQDGTIFIEEKFKIQNILAYSLLTKCKYERKITHRTSGGLMLKYYSRVDNSNFKYKGMEASLFYRIYLKETAMFGPFAETRGIAGAFDWKFYYSYSDVLGNSDIVSFTEHLKSYGLGVNFGYQWNIGYSKNNSFELAFGFNYVPLPAKIESTKTLNGNEYNLMTASPCTGFLCRGVSWKGLLLPGSPIFSNIALGFAF